MGAAARPRRTGMFVLGVTGGIGAGKSTVARLLAARGAVILDADAIVADAYRGGELPRRVAARFGAAVLAPDGSVDRPALARLVFRDAAARADLEAIVHPEVRRRVTDAIAELRAAGTAGLVVVDAALLVEASPPYPLDALLVVTAPEAVRLDRLAARGVPREEARRRMAAQIDDRARVARADVVVVNDGDRAALEAAVLRALADLGRDVPERSGYTGAAPEAPGGDE